MIETLFTKVKQQCIGRYIIDVPASLHNQLTNVITIDDFRIESKPLYPPAFKQRISLREKELHDSINKPDNDPENSPFIKETIQLPSGKGIIFDHNADGDDDFFRILEGHIYVDGIAFIITTQILDLSAPKYTERKKTYLKAGFTEEKTNEKPQRLAALQSLISRLSGRQDDAIPTEKGLCIPNGFIKDDAAVHKEKVSFSYENSDFNYGLDFSNTLKGSQDTLMNRGPEIEAVLAQTTLLRTIKKGAFNRGGINNQEWLIAGVKESNELNATLPFFDFVLYANEDVGSPTKPWLAMALSNRDKKTQYNEAQMVEIWERLVNSLRYRPGAF
ncbi:hypothetical protein GWD52_02385 [Enterobacteriaceae bacterium 4M9]|nr:hypothetical protein [Enterobacteriaceae bacterium 4M9]